MKNARMTWGVLTLAAALAGFVGPGAAWADTADPDLTDVDATQAGVDLTPIRERARSMPVDRRIDIDKRIAATVERVNAQASAKGQSAVAARLAAEFKLASEALLDEKAKHGLSWGEMVIAHTLLANSSDKVALSDLMSLRSEGLGWGAIAFGLRFHLEDLEEAIKAEGKVAMGLVKADGKTAAIGRQGPGAP